MEYSIKSKNISNENILIYNDIATVFMKYLIDIGNCININEFDNKVDKLYILLTVNKYY